MKTLLSYVIRAFCLGVLALLWSGSMAPLQAQQDQIIGTVVDETNNVLPDAFVVVRNEASGFFKNVKTDGAGRFVATGLNAGAYTVEVSAPGFTTLRREGIQATALSTEDLTFKLSVASITESVTVEAAISLASEAAPSQASLEARSAQSLISPTYVRNFTSPTGDYSDVIQMSPGTFSVSANGPGLGDTKTFFRGFKDGFYNMTFDGLPFNDTNDPTHHSWVWFPTPFIGATVFDRSPGDAESREWSQPKDETGIQDQINQVRYPQHAHRD